MTDERRQHPRVPADTVVRMHFSTIGEFMQSQAENISTGGMQLVTARPLAVGDLIGLEFRLTSNYPLIEGTATVKWCRPHGEHFRVGVEFGQLDERSTRVIEEAVRHQERSAAEVTEDLLVAPDGFDDAVELEPDSAVLDVETADLEPSVVEPPAVAPDPWDVEEVVADLPPPEAFDVGESVTSGSFDDDASALDAGVDWGDVSVDVGEASADADSGTSETFDFGDVSAEVADLTPPPAAPAAPPAPPQPGTFEFEDLPPAEESFDEASFDGGVPIGSMGGEAATSAVTAAPRPRRKGLMIGLLVGAVLALGLMVWGLMPRDGGDDLGGAGDQVAAPMPAAPMPAAATAPGEATVAAAAEPEATAPTADQPAATPPAAAEAVPAPVPAPAAKPEPKPAPQPKPTPAVAASAGPASTIVGIRAGEGRTLLTVEGDGSWQGKYRTFALKAPARIVVDLQEAALAKGVRAPAGSGVVQNVRVGRHEGKIRIVLDMTADTPYTIDLDGKRLHVRRR